MPFVKSFLSTAPCELAIQFASYRVFVFINMFYCVSKIDCEIARTSFGTRGIFVSYFLENDNALIHLRNQIKDEIFKNFWHDFDWGLKILELMYCQGEVDLAMHLFHQYQNYFRFSCIKAQFNDCKI